MYSVFNKNKQRLHRHVRIRAKISGTPECPRISVYRSNKFIYAALIDDVAGKTLAAVDSSKLGLDNPSNCEAATKVGEEFAKKAADLKIAKAVFDRSGYLYHGQVKALAEACRKGGLAF